jgi:hypothetical protein
VTACSVFGFSPDLTSTVSPLLLNLPPISSSPVTRPRRWRHAAHPRPTSSPGPT